MPNTSEFLQLIEILARCFAGCMAKISNDGVMARPGATYAKQAVVLENLVWAREYWSDGEHRTTKDPLKPIAPLLHYSITPSRA